MDREDADTGGPDREGISYPTVNADTDKLDGLSPEIHRTLRMIMGFSSESLQNPILEKINDEHIHKLLDYRHQDEVNNFRIRCSSQWFALLYAILGLGVFVFLIVYLLPTDKELLLDLIKLLVVFIGGFGSGFGVKSYLSSKE